MNGNRELARRAQERMQIALDKIASELKHLNRQIKELIEIKRQP